MTLLQHSSDGDIGWHLLYVVAPVVIPIVIGQVLAYRANRKRGMEKDNILGTLLKEYRLHTHNENDGPLHAENIRYPRSSSNIDSRSDR